MEGKVDIRCFCSTRVPSYRRREMPATLVHLVTWVIHMEYLHDKNEAIGSTDAEFSAGPTLYTRDVWRCQRRAALTERSGRVEHCVPPILLFAVSLFIAVSIVTPLIDVNNSPLEAHNDR